MPEIILDSGLHRDISDFEFIHGKKQFSREPDFCGGTSLLSGSSSPDRFHFKSDIDCREGDEGLLKMESGTKYRFRVTRVSNEQYSAVVLTDQ